MLRPRGLFLLDDWVRMPLAQYVQTRPRDSNGALAYQRSRCLRMFPFHNKYAVGVWKWLLAEAGFSLVSTAQLWRQSQIFVVVENPLPRPF